MDHLKAWVILSWVIAGSVIALGAAEGCTKPQAKAAGSAAVQVAVDLCKETGDLPTGTASDVISIVCAAVDATAPGVQVLINRAEWNGMKSRYLAMHGALPKGMTAPEGSTLPPSARP